MRKVTYPFLCLTIISLSGCVTFYKDRTKVSNFACQHKDTIVALALSVGDAATANAIDAYCATPASTSPVTSPGH